MIVNTKESLKREIDRFNNEQLNQVAGFIAFIKFQAKFNKQTDISQFVTHVPLLFS